MVWVCLWFWICCGRLPISQFWLLFKSDSNWGIHVVFFPTLYFFIFKLGWHVVLYLVCIFDRFEICVSGHFFIGFSVGAAVSLTFDCVSIMTRVRNIFCDYFHIFSRLFFFLYFLRFKYVRHAVIMVVDIKPSNVHGSRSHGTCPYSLLSRFWTHMTDPSLLTPCMDFGLRINWSNDENSIGHT